ncbi:Claspin [Acromyrmex echinatior]|uniref:Claspin n=1 Tax=Acromyrmex echinatior TaxID=103372 RepID=F4WFU2_ACREC|nr:Claspin [Acromyrmex echinatior]
MGSDFVEQSTLCETLIKTANVDNEYYSGSPETDLQIAEHKNNSKSRSIRRIIDSESEEDTQTSESYNFAQKVFHTTTAKNYRALIDSESEEEKQNEETESEKDTQTSESNNLPQTVFISENRISDSESKEEKQNEKTKNDISIIFNKASENKDIKKKSLKKRRGSIRASKDEAMRQIHSESQRLLRETEISLPYHRPKQRTLQEFLNRKRVSAVLPKAPSTAAKLKMSSAIVSQVLAEKEKEAELFYKSSDSEDDVQSMPLITDECEKIDNHLQVLSKSADETLANRKKLSTLVSNSKVTLRGSPGMIIDLTDDVKSKKQSDNKSEITVVHLQNMQNLLPINEVLPYKTPVNIDNSELNKPGAKLMRLKEDLKLQMILKRNKVWKLKEIKMQTQEEEWNREEKSDYDLDEQEQAELDFVSSDSEESELEENDVCIRDKKKSKCLFADDEAEVTDNEDSNIDNVNACESFNITKNDRKIKLTEEFQNDSNVTNPSCLQNHSSQLNMPTDINASKIHCDDIDWISENESNMPACQQEISTRSQICKTPLTKTSMLDLVSPITQLSVLNTTLENEKDSSQKRGCLVDKYEFLFMKSTQNDELFEHVCNVKNKSILKKKLFDDIGETVDDEYLMRLCSGKFESPQRTDIDLFSQSSITELQLCSNDSECSRNSNAKLVAVKNSKDKMLQNIKLTLDEDSNNSVNHAEKINKVSAMNSELKLRVMSSDDEDEDTFLKPKKRLVKVLNLSDSEEENSQFFDKEDDINSEEKQYVDYDSEENEIIIVPEKDIKKVAASFVEEEAELSESDWDSADEDEKNLDKLEFEEADDEHIDEHEVKDQLEKIHIKQLLDEDKRDVRLLKELLFEDGDLHSDGMGRERKFKWKNIDKLGNNIEMSTQISDENEGWVDVQDDEEEAKWSKLKNERDRFLEERMKCSNNEIEDELCHSKIFKLGLEAVKKIKGNESQKQDTSLDKVNSFENIEPIMPRNITDLLNGPSIGKKSQTRYNVIKKRSLLTRGEESLARIASLAKQSDSISHAVNIRRNFIFPHIDQDINNTLKKETETIADLDLQIKVHNLII